ncbi:hypothetical protein KCU91_g4859, partial [Aureobasidium melanogenum]
MATPSCHYLPHLAQETCAACRYLPCTAILEVIGTIVETITVFSIFFSVCAQLWGARVFWLMSQQHRKAADAALADESAPKDAESDYQQEIILSKEDSIHDQDHSMADLENTEQMV